MSALDEGSTFNVCLLVWDENDPLPPEPEVEIEPGITGDELTQEILKVDPDLVTVLITGWEVPESDDLLELFDFRIQKPFRLSEIKEVVQRAVEQSGRKSET